ncbi:MAG: flagellar M-ring protein FliF [Candidatus Azotimanducaceae bacterium]|jgi:flagellar M-ring protein FliF
MAAVPAVAEPIEATEPAAAKSSGMSSGRGMINRFDDKSSLYGQTDATKGFLNLPFFRQIGLMVGLAGVISLGFMMVIWSQAPDYRPLYPNLESNQTASVVNVLTQSNITFTVDPVTGLVLVPAGEIDTARMKVAGANIIAPSGLGYGILDKEQELGTSQMMETAKYRRAIEGELARTISSLQNVRKARVLLAIPKQSVFVRDNRKPSASVFIELALGSSIEVQQVKAIMHLVAYSIPSMSKTDVSVVDQFGNLLSELENKGSLAESEKQLQYSSKVEDGLLKKINRILQPVLGDTRFRAEVAADVDFTWVEETQEMFNPDLPSIRSEVTNEDRQTGSAQGGIPGALSNQPPGETSLPEEIGEGGENGNTSIRLQKNATRNYELDRTISHTKHQVGQVTRLTVSVVLDDIKISNSETGVADVTRWDDASLARLNQLVRDAVGFNVSRGDRVTVINESFLATEIPVIPEVDFWTEAWFLALVKQIMVALMVIFLAFFVLKPVLKMLAGPSAEDRMKSMMAEQELERLAEEELEKEEEMMHETVTLSGGEELLLPGPGDTFVRQLDAIRSLVDENPTRVSQVVKEWVSEG